MKDIFIESVNSYNGLDDTRKDAIISLYRTLFEADEAKPEAKPEEKKEDKKEENKEEKKDDAATANGNTEDPNPLNIIRNRTPNNVRKRPTKGDVKFIALHYTAGGSSTKGHATRTTFRPKTSADFIVDDGEIYQYNPDLDIYYTWAVGVEPEQFQKNLDAAKKRGTHGAGEYHNKAYNQNTISIEMCSNYKGGSVPEDASPYSENYYLTEATLANTAKLVAYLHKKYPQAQIVRHFDITGKPCPGPWCRDDNGTATFKAFVSRCLSTPVPGDPEYDNVEDMMLEKDDQPPWPDFGRQFAPDKTATTSAVEDIATGLGGAEELGNMAVQAMGLPIADALKNILKKTNSKIPQDVIDGFVDMLLKPKNREMLKNVLKLVPKQ